VKAAADWVASDLGRVNFGGALLIHSRRLTTDQSYVPEVRSRTLLEWRWEWDALSRGVGRRLLVLILFPKGYAYEILARRGFSITDEVEVGRQ
jgi:hypothetical protein